VDVIDFESTLIIFSKGMLQGLGFGAK